VYTFINKLRNKCEPLDSMTSRGFLSKMNNLNFSRKTLHKTKNQSHSQFKLIGSIYTAEFQNTLNKNCMVI